MSDGRPDTSADRDILSTRRSPVITLPEFTQVKVTDRATTVSGLAPWIYGSAVFWRTFS